VNWIYTRPTFLFPFHSTLAPPGNPILVERSRYLTGIAAGEGKRTAMREERSSRLRHHLLATAMRAEFHRDIHVTGGSFG
jgi:hypothetical protein